MEFRIRSIEVERIFIKISCHIPGTRRVIDMIRIRMRTEALPRINPVALRLLNFIRETQIQVVLLNKVFHILRANILILLGKGIFKIKVINPQLIRHHDIGIVRNTACDEMMSSDGFKPPDFLLIRESNTVGLIRAVLRKKFSQTLYPFFRAVDIRENERNKVLFSDSSNHFRLSVLCGPILDKRIGGKHTLVIGNRFRRGHGNVFTVDSCCAPNTAAFYGIRHIGIAKPLLRKRNLHMAPNGSISEVSILRFPDKPLLRAEGSSTRILIPGYHCRTVKTCFSAY